MKRRAGWRVDGTVIVMADQEAVCRPGLQTAGISLYCLTKTPGFLFIG